MESISKEMVAKAYIYNMIINLQNQIESEQLKPRRRTQTKRIKPQSSFTKIPPRKNSRSDFTLQCINMNPKQVSLYMLKTF
jgi:hypothetical protein